MTCFLLGMGTAFALAAGLWLVGAALSGRGKLLRPKGTFFETPGWFEKKGKR